MRVLHLEDSRLDAVLTAHRLSREWPDCQVHCASTREQFESALAVGDFDLILSDYTMDGYNGLAALDHARERCPDKPFIFFSGTIGEERAHNALQHGAADYVSKAQPAGLVFAIRRALEQRENALRHREAGPEQSPNPGEAPEFRAGFIGKEGAISRNSAFGSALPVPTAGGVRPTQTPRHDGKFGGGEGILVIDDEQSLRELFSAVLTARGYRVYKAGSGREGLAVFDANRSEIAMVLTDLTMNGMDGIEVIRALRARAVRLPILAMSGMAGTGVYDRKVRELGVPLLAKPLDRATLLTKIRAALAAAVSPG